MKNFIELKNVVKSYDIGDKKYNALDGIDFSIPKGEFVVILGPSGAGKSTLLNLLGGMDKATSGHIFVDGDDIAQYSSKKLTTYRAEDVGFIFQFYNILPTLTVLENVSIVNDIVKKPKNAKRILKEVGLEKHYNKFPNQLSGGEQQRVSIARAIAKNPKLLLCDEPTGALDSKTGVEVLKLLKKQCDANNEENTVIIVTHNANVVLGADAEEIIIANQDGIGTENAEKRFEYRSGAIENDEILTDDTGVTLKGILNQNGIQTQICDILEGGRPAFKLRQNKYAGIQHD